jgi:hypothetical protein
MNPILAELQAFAALHGMGLVVTPVAIHETTSMLQAFMTGILPGTVVM